MYGRDSANRHRPAAPQCDSARGRPIRCFPRNSNRAARHHSAQRWTSHSRVLLLCSCVSVCASGAAAAAAPLAVVGAGLSWSGNMVVGLRDKYPCLVEKVPCEILTWIAVQGGGPFSWSLRKKCRGRHCKLPELLELSRGTPQPRKSILAD